MSRKINRRKFFTDTAMSAAGIMLGSSFVGCTTRQEAEISSFKIMEEVKKYRKIDTHIHVNLFGSSTPEDLIDYADRLEVEKMVISRPITQGAATPDAIIESNNLVLKAMNQYPDRFVGQLTLNVIHQKESLEEISRCVDKGMVGLKVYNQVKINDPLFFPIIEKFIDLKMIILMHSNSAIGMGGQRTKYGNIQPNASVPEDFVDAARRYPEAMFQFAHTGGGGDWEYECKTMKDCKNIFVDLSGSNNEENMINFAIEYLGEDRLFYASDNSFYQCIGNMLASNLNEKQKRKIFFDNYNNILKKGGYHVS